MISTQKRYENKVNWTKKEFGRIEHGGRKEKNDVDEIEISSIE